MKELSRRRLLQGLLTLGMAPLVGCGGNRTPIQNLLSGLLQEIALPDPLQVGLAHLRNTPADRDPSDLLEAVFADLPLEDGLSNLRPAFARRLRQEFASQQTISTDGWLLSLSESRFCALLAMCFFETRSPDSTKGGRYKTPSVGSSRPKEYFVAGNSDRC